MSGKSYASISDLKKNIEDVSEKRKKNKQFKKKSIKKQKTNSNNTQQSSSEEEEEEGEESDSEIINDPYSHQRGNESNDDGNSDNDDDIINLNNSKKNIIFDTDIRQNESDEETKEKEETEENDINEVNASVRKGNRIIVDDLNRKIRDRDYNEIKLNEPPYTPSLLPNELKSMIEYENRRLDNEEILNLDPDIQYIKSVSGFSYTDEKNLRTGSSVKTNSGQPSLSVTKGFSPYGNVGNMHESSVRGTVLGHRTKTNRNRNDPVALNLSPDTTAKSKYTIKNDFSGAKDLRDSDEDENILNRQPFNTTTTQPLNNPIFNANRNKIKEKSKGEPSIYDMLKDPAFKELAEDWTSRQRMFGSKQWIEHPSVSGVMNLSNLASSHASKAFNLISIRCPLLRGISEEELVRNSITRTLYAELTGLCITSTKISVGTKSFPDKANKRTDAKINDIIRVFQKMKRDQYSGQLIYSDEYSNNSNINIYNNNDSSSFFGSSNNMFPTTSQGNLLPRSLFGI